jgi:hypothetical protein
MINGQSRRTPSRFFFSRFDHRAKKMMPIPTTARTSEVKRIITPNMPLSSKVDGQKSANTIEFYRRAN